MSAYSQVYIDFRLYGHVTENVREFSLAARVGRIMLENLPIILFPYSHNFALLFPS